MLAIEGLIKRETNYVMTDYDRLAVFFQWKVLFEQKNLLTETEPRLLEYPAQVHIHRISYSSTRMALV